MMRNKKRSKMKRRVVLEALETRQLLSGVTLIAHGLEFSTGFPQWIADMGTAIAARAGGPVSTYTLTVTGSLFSGMNISVSSVTGANPLTSSTGEIILLLDWSNASGLFNLATTGQVAQVVHDAMVSPTFISDLQGKSLAEVGPIQMIGHSRGTSVVSGVAQLLGEDGIWVDQLTTLDPNYQQGIDTDVSAWSNVRFFDNYWRGTSGDVVVPAGHSVDGAHNVHLDDSIVDSPGYFDGHNNTHLWYHGTIDQSSDASEEGHTVGSDWYPSGDQGPRDQVGFDWSRIGAGVRPADGLAADGASRVAVSVSSSGADVWDNIELTNVAGAQTLSAQSMSLNGNLQDVNGDATVTFGWDTDRNPYDGTTGVTTSYGAANLGSSFNGAGLTRNGLSTGTYYVYAKITNGTHTRYYYGEGAVAVQAAAVPTLHLPLNYVNQLYHDLFHRDVDPTGAQVWVGMLNAGASIASVAAGIVGSREYQGGVVNSFYESYLGREAETAGLNGWVDSLQAGANIETIRAGILGSDEYFGLVGRDNTAFVTQLYRTFLGREPDASGLAHWVSLIGADPGTRVGVALGIASSHENHTAVVTSYYQNYLRRAADASGLAGFVNQLDAGVPQAQIVIDFLVSGEYLRLNGIS